MQKPIKIYLLRHAQPMEPWYDFDDSSLSKNGHRQAESAARMMGPLGPLPIWTSPLKRAVETAAPLARIWEEIPSIEPRLREISPPNSDPLSRGSWLTTLLMAKWESMEENFQNWRRQILDAVQSIEKDTVIVTHFVVINVIVGAATNENRVICCNPDNVDMIVINKSKERLEVASYGLGKDSQVSKNAATIS